MERINVAYCFSEQYVTIAKTSILSIIENCKKNRNLVFFLLCENLTENTKQDIEKMIGFYGHCLKWIDTLAIDDILKKLDLRKYKSYITYYKVFLPQVLADHVDKVIYLGSDTLIMDDLGELWTCDMGENAALMIIDGISNRYKKYINVNYDINYYNDDVILFDVKKWNAEKCTERCINEMKTKGVEYPLAEQDLLNKVVGNNIGVLPLQYGWQSQCCLYEGDDIRKVYELPMNAYYDVNDIIRAKKEIVIYHFCGNSFIRPWYINSKHPMAKQYQKYLVKANPDIVLKKAKWARGYLLQYISYKFFPRKIKIIFNRLLQKIFMRINYGV